MTRRKIFYFCRRGQGTHFQFYTGWVMEAKKQGLPIQLVTTISFKEFFNINPNFRKKEFIFIPCFKIIDTLVILLFFTFQFLRNEYTIVQLRKRNYLIFQKLEYFFSKKFKYIIESEGDLVFEYEYLETHPYKKHFYDHILKNKERNFKNYKRKLLKADHIICVSENLKRLYSSRYNINEKKLTTLTTGCDSKIFYYNKEKRDKMRKELGLKSNFVLIYIGNVYYSWQNISLTLKYYKIISKIKRKTKLIILTRFIDKPIILNFLDKYDIDISEIVLKYSIPNKLVPDYLNAADLGIILREDHPMNHVASPGKFGEYACCGLPILTGKGIADFSDKLSKTPYGIVLDNIYDNSEFLIKTFKIMENYENLDRTEISKWGKLNFSLNVYIDKYTQLLKRLLNEN